MLLYVSIYRHKFTRLLPLVKHYLVTYKKRIVLVLFGLFLENLRSLRLDHPKLPCYIVACVDLPYELDGVSILPWQDFLKNIKSFL